MKKIIIIVGIVVVALIGFVFLKGSSGQEVSRLDTTDTVRSFYDEWLAAAKDQNVEPNKEALTKTPILSKELRDKIASALTSGEAMDPVLCQTTVPEEISTRTVFEDAEGAQILVTSKDKKVTDQAIVSLASKDGGWYIKDIECSLGEFAPKKEFSFEAEGYMLKGSIPPPYDPKNWHLVYEENGQKGNVVPILFDSESQCTLFDKSKAVCKPTDFAEATKVSIKGQMTERGVSVKQLEVVKQ